MGLKNDARNVRKMLSIRRDTPYQMWCPFCGRIINITIQARPRLTVYDSISGTEIYEATCEDCHITYSSEVLGGLKPIKRKP